MKRIIAVALSGAWFSLIANTAALAEAPPPIDAFARLPQVRNVTVSPDGNQIAYISALGDNSIAVTVDLRHPDEPLHPLMRSEPGKYEIGVQRDPASIMLSRGWSFPTSGNKRVQSLSREARKYAL